MSRKGENIYKRKDGRWEGRYIIGKKENGKSIYKSVYASSYSEVKTKLKEQVVLQIEQQFYTSHISKENKLLEEVLFCWLEAIKPSIKESSYNKYENLIQIDIIPYLGKYKISEISTEKMKVYIMTLLTGSSQHKSLKVKTIKDILSIIKRVFRYASNQGYFVNCDFSLLKLPKEIGTPTVLTKEDEKRLISHLLSSGNLSAAGIYLTLFTGLRIGEICALKWENIHLDKRQIIISNTMQRIQDKSPNALHKTKIIITKPKSNYSERVIPIPDFLVMYLKKLSKDGSAYFLTGNSETFMEPRTLQNHLKNFLCELGIRNVTYHTLRHTFATRCIEMGFDIKSLSEILGHSNVNITLNCYVHPSDELKRENMEKLSLLFTVK